MTNDEFLWLVGFYEGEGSCGCYRKTCYAKSGKKYICPHGSLKVTIAQKDRAIIEWIKKTVGYGHIGQRIQKNPSSFGHELWWWWAASAKEAEQFLKLLKPHIRISRRAAQIENALELYRRAKV